MSHTTRNAGVESGKHCDSKGPFLRDVEDVPHEGALPDLYAPGGLLCGIKLNLLAGLSVVGNPAAWDCALIIAPDTPAAPVREALYELSLAGLEPLTEEEHEPELLDDGSVRLWLVPTNPEDPFKESSTTEEMEIAA
ncbi:hypothetical protein [Streptomyces sp. NBC_01236]|uniref:hypothetical protein n=1 Tax=Streptomyces sp. NBC_01236 TaxID=2903789 RepID=UPI002E0F203E|nr:hypothetical protein OG324_32130 [Streptomyces sp. NBC_01236]